MKLSDKLQVEMEQKRGRILELARVGQPSQENRQELGQIKSALLVLADRQSAAVAAEGSERIDEALTGERPEDRETQRLFNEASLARYMVTAATKDSNLDGAEAELNAAFGLIQTESEFPLRLLAPRAEAMQDEHRADAATSLGFNTVQMSGNWILRMLATSNARHIGVTMKSVAPGVHIYPVVGGTNAASTPTKGTAVDAAAATVSTKEHEPRAVQARYLIHDEDRMRLSMSYDEALRADLRNQIAAGMDNFVFSDSTDGMIVTVPAASGDAAITGASSFADMHEGVLSAIDGLYAHELMDLNVSCRPAVYGYAGTQAPSSTAAFLTDYLKSMGCTVRSNAHIGEITGQAGESYALVSKARGIQGAACLTMWEAGRLVVDQTGELLAKRQTALDVVGYFDFDVLRTASFHKFRIAVS